MLIVGADPTHLTAATPLLCAISKRVRPFGERGAGTTYTLIINMIGAVQIASVAEGIEVAEKAGLDLGAVVEVIATDQAASPQVVRSSRRMIEGDPDENVVFTTLLRLKDVEGALQVARALGIGSPFGKLAAEHCCHLIGHGRSRANESKAIDVSRLQQPAE